MILVQYGEFNCVVLQGSWTKHVKQGRRAIKKDVCGLWNVLNNASYGPKENPYVLPNSVSQVFFMKDSIDP